MLNHSHIEHLRLVGSAPHCQRTDPSCGTMSTPSTATATLPPHHAHYGYPHHRTYQANSAQHSPNDPVLGGSSRLTHTYNSYPSLTSTSTRNSTASTRTQMPANSKTLSQTTATTSRSRPQRQPDWNDFYRNGVPQEIIVIDDSPPPPHQKPGNQTSHHSSHNGGKTPIEPASKKRRTGQAQDTALARHQLSYSDTNTPHYVGSGSNTISTDRTASLQTTAPTSLGSHGSGSSGGVHVNGQMAGQKRKRVTRQSTAADEKKRREIEVVGDAYSCYVPPPRPPIKAPDVPVKLIKDVSYVI